MMVGPKFSVTAYDSEPYVRCGQPSVSHLMSSTPSVCACWTYVVVDAAGRAGRATQVRRQMSTPYSYPFGNGASIIVGNGRPTRLRPWARVDKHLRQPCAITLIHVPRCPKAVGRALTFGSMNVQSLSSTKFDVLLDVHRENRLDVMLLCEAWHDPDSVSISRLRAGGFTVVERARQ